MALVLADRVKETSTTFGLSDMVLLGAASGGYRAFNQVLSSGDTTYYCIVLQSANEWEVGIGTYSGVSNALTRNTVLSSSNNNNPVSFGIGTKDVFITYAAGRSIYANGTTLQTTNGAILPVASGGSGASTAATARTNFGATTVGSNLFTLTNPSAITFLRVNADNSVSALDAATFRTAIGAGVGSVTSVAMTVPTGLSISGTPITSSGTLALTLTSGYSIPTTASQANWDSAYTQRLQWDGGSTNLVAATGRTSLGATTVGGNMFTLTNPSAVTFPRFNADNTVSALDAASFRTAIGAGTGSGTVTGVTATAPIASSGGAAPVISINAAYGDTQNPYASKTANYVLAAPNGTAGVPTFRALVAADIPSLSGTYLPLTGGTVTGALDVSGNYINGGGHMVYVRDYTVPTATNVAIVADGITSTTLVAGTAYEVHLTTLATGTNTGAKYIVYQTAATTWVAKLVSRQSGTSNNPTLAISGTTMVVSHAHASTYSIRVLIERFATGNATLTSPYYFGMDAALTYDGDTNAVAFGTKAVSGITTLSMSGQLTNTVATGTAPMVISSTTRVSNLNVATAGTADVATASTITTSSTASAFKVPFANTTASTTGNYGLLQDSAAEFTYNPSTNTLAVGTVSGTATNATNVTATTSTTASAFKVPFLNTTASTTGNYGLLQDSTATFTYNPSTNTLTADTFSGDLSGNATTATSASSSTQTSSLYFANPAAVVTATQTLPTVTTAMALVISDATNKYANFEPVVKSLTSSDSSVTISETSPGVWDITAGGGGGGGWYTLQTTGSYATTIAMPGAWTNSPSGSYGNLFIGANANGMGWATGLTPPWWSSSTSYGGWGSSNSPYYSAYYNWSSVTNPASAWGVAPSSGFTFVYMQYPPQSSNTSQSDSWGSATSWNNGFGSSWSTFAPSSGSTRVFYLVLLVSGNNTITANGSLSGTTLETAYDSWSNTTYAFFKCTDNTSVGNILSGTTAISWGMSNSYYGHAWYEYT